MGIKSTKNEPNPISGLTQNDVKIVQRTWSYVFKRRDEYGVELFFRFYRADPEALKFFRVIRNMNEDEMRRNAQFRTHVKNFMTVFNLTIRKLNKPEQVAQMFERLGATHKKMGISQKHFENLKTVLVNFLINDLKLKQNELEAWTRFVTFAYSRIFVTLQ